MPAGAGRTCRMSCVGGTERPVIFGRAPQELVWRFVTARVGIVTFPGSLDEGEAARAVRRAGGEPVPLWHAERDLRGADAVILPGGFSYGDYLRCGAIARFSPVMNELAAAVQA